jgi:predicted RNA-binding Zn-ribbon protein involved in translation (DUF1610 family)
MARQSDKRDEEWKKFEEEVLREMREARQRGLLTNSLDEIEEVVDEVGKRVEAKLLGTIAEQREGEGTQRCPECGEKMQRRGKTARQLKTSKGDVSFKRERWVCPKCGASIFPPG